MCAEWGKEEESKDHESWAHLKTGFAVWMPSRCFGSMASNTRSGSSSTLFFACATLLNKPLMSSSLKPPPELSAILKESKLGCSTLEDAAYLVMLQDPCRIPILLAGSIQFENAFAVWKTHRVMIVARIDLAVFDE
jgi:hypothetical protein